MVAKRLSGENTRACPIGSRLIPFTTIPWIAFFCAFVAGTVCARAHLGSTDVTSRRNEIRKRPVRRCSICALFGTVRPNRARVLSFHARITAKSLQAARGSLEQQIPRFNCCVPSRTTPWSSGCNRVHPDGYPGSILLNRKQYS